MASLNARRKNYPVSSSRFKPSLSSSILDDADYLVSVGLHETSGIRDSYYLNLADQMLHQRSSSDRTWRILSA